SVGGSVYLSGGSRGSGVPGGGYGTSPVGRGTLGNSPFYGTGPIPGRGTGYPVSDVPRPVYGTGALSPRGANAIHGNLPLGGGLLSRPTLGGSGLVLVAVPAGALSGTGSTFAGAGAAAGAVTAPVPARVDQSVASQTQQITSAIRQAS